MVVNESFVLPNHDGTLRPHSYTANSDHTYCYILETNNPQNFEKKDVTFQKVKLPWNGLFLFVVIFGAVLTVILTAILTEALTSIQPKKGNDESRVMYFSIYKGDMGEEEVKVPLSPRLHSRSRANGDEKCSLKKNIENTGKAISEIAKSKPAQQYIFILYGDDVEEIGPLKALEAQNTVKSLRPKPQNNFNQTGAIKTFLSKSQDRKKDILVHYVPCNFTYNADDPEMEVLAKMITSETGLSKKFSLV
ncbi:unnamed protein product [Cylicocyclus nassatus]|uniref:Uncharacterized protein n=1 Tax=Cylicocyclus nassatus TaxID=53992 RepID=A0AA36MA24_CYLNA|nr:unnamed protein product [Cylicocyclus nassatus]